MGAVVDGFRSTVAVVALPVRAYRLVASPWVGHGCRFQPTCSAYAVEALERHGVKADVVSRPRV